MNIELIRRALYCGWRYVQVEASAESELLLLNALKEVGELSPHLEGRIAFVEKQAALDAELEAKWEAECDAKWEAKYGKE